MALLLLTLFVAIPALELYLLVTIGRAIGIGSTLLLVIGTGIAGAALAKSQGRRALRDYRETLARGELPTATALGGVLIIAGGLLLLLPGVLTDLVGLILLVPFTRTFAVRLLRHGLERRIRAGTLHVRRGAVPRASDRVIEVEKREP